MNRIASHLRRFWHIHLTVYSLLASALLFSAGGAAGVALYRHFHGGFRPGPLPPAIHLSGFALPSSWSLAPYITRIHNQGSSSSCVGQTLATIEEITQAERRPGTPPKDWVSAYSAGYIYDQVHLNGCDCGATYNDAFGVLTSQGDATLAAFPHDGQDFTAAITTIARRNAARYRFRTFRSIDPADRATIEAELHAGRPIALALPVHDTFYYLTGDAPITSDTGSFHFWHSITVIGYSPIGIRVLNSWGPSWGANGQATLSWSFLADVGAAMVISMPTPYHPRRHPRPRATPTPVVHTTAIPVHTPSPTRTPVPAARPTPTPVLLVPPTASARPTPQNGTICVASGPYPDPRCTPGEAFPGATTSQVCTPGYTRTVRNVPYSEKLAAYAEYGISSHQPGQYEVDHFIPLELGGDNSLANLWPEPAAPQPGFHEKDVVENALHDEVCTHLLTLAQAQAEITADWIAVYKRIALATGGHSPRWRLPGPPITGKRQ